MLATWIGRSNLRVSAIRKGARMTGYDDRDMLLYIAAYGDDAAAARRDYKSLNQLGDTGVVASVLLDRDADGKVKVDEHGGRQIPAGMTAGAMGGLLIGVFVPPLLASAAFGAGVGATVGAVLKRRDRDTIASSVEADDWLPPSSSAIIAIIDPQYLESVDAVVTNAVRKTSKGVRKDDYDALVEALVEGDQNIVDAMGPDAS
jgi:uncharacterized membrane protein